MRLITTEAIFMGSLKYKARRITCAIKEQNFEIVNINEPQDLKVKPIVGGPKCPTRKLSELINC